MPGPQMFVPFARARAVLDDLTRASMTMRHTGGLSATMTGASLPEVMARLGHSTSPLLCATNTRRKVETPRLEVYRPR